MNGATHYVEAERLAGAYKQAIADAEAMPTDTPLQADERYFAASNARTLLEKAQVHATLAVAAATAEHIAQTYTGTTDTTIPHAWAEAIS